MKVKGVTVGQLALACNVLINQGYGDKTILISDDDEGNGYHTLFYTFFTDEKEIESLGKSGMFHDDNDPEDVVILG